MIVPVGDSEGGTDREAYGTIMTIKEGIRSMVIRVLFPCHVHTSLLERILVPLDRTRLREAGT